MVDPGGKAVTLVPDGGAGTTKDGRRLVVLREDWFVCYAPAGELYRVPASFVTDFASVPDTFWALAPPWGQWNEAAVVHDWIYAVGEPGQRAHADEVFHWTMLQTRVKRVQADGMYEAVRLGGGNGYGLPGDWRFLRFGLPDNPHPDPADLPKLAWRDMPAPIAKPQHAWVAHVDCSTFDRDVEAYRLKYASRVSAKVAPFAPAPPTRSP